MKRTLITIFTLLAVLLAVLFFIYRWWITTPEYAIKQIVNDVESGGLDGLMPHLTVDAAKVVDSVASVVENPIVSGITSLFVDDKSAFVKENLSAMEWDIGDILKGEQKTDVIVKFTYNDDSSGSIRIFLINEDGEWKIDSIGIPSFG